MRIGTGFDVHKFGAATVKMIRIGGVDVPYHQEVIAHSDGDVVLHALCDAMLGALALGDIGHHFPDSDAEFANVDSRNLLKHVYKLLAHRTEVFVVADLCQPCFAVCPSARPASPPLRPSLFRNLPKGKVYVIGRELEGQV